MKNLLLILASLFLLSSGFSQYFSSEILPLKGSTTLGNLGSNDTHFFLSQNLRVSLSSDPQPSRMRYVVLDKENLAMRTVEIGSIKFDKQNAIYVCGQYYEGAIYELYFAGKYSLGKADNYLYLVKRNIEDFQVIGTPVRVNQGRFFSTTEYNLFIDKDGLFVINENTNLIARYDLDLNGLWKANMPVLKMLDKETNTQINSEIRFNEKNKTVVIQSNIGQCNDCAWGLVGEMARKKDYHVKQMFTIITDGKEVMEFTPTITTDLSFRKVEFYYDMEEESVSAIYERYDVDEKATVKDSPQSGFYFYKWNVNNGAIISENNFILKQTDIIDETIENFIRWYGAEVIPVVADAEVANSQMELCKRLPNGDFIMSFSLYNPIEIKYDLRKINENFNRCNLNVCVDPDGTIKWMKPTLYDGFFKSDETIHAITKDLKLITLNFEYSENFNGEEYKLTKFGNPFNADCYVLSVIDLKNGDILSNTKITTDMKYSELKSNPMYDKDLNQLLVGAEFGFKHQFFLFDSSKF